MARVVCTPLLLGLCLAVGLLALPDVAAEELLTEAERSWVKQNPIIKVGAETDWPPFDFTIAGKATGYSNDFVRLLASKVGLQPQFITGPSFKELLEAAKAHELDLLPALWMNEERQQYLTFLPPYYNTRHVIFVAQGDNRIASLADLKGKRLVGVAGYNTTKQLRELLPDTPIKEVQGPLPALLALENGEADAYIGSLAIGVFFCHEHGLSAIKHVDGLAGSPLASNEALHLAVRNDRPELAAILAKAQRAVTASELAELRRRWFAELPQHGLPWRTVLLWVSVLSAFVLIVIGAVLIRNRRLAREVVQRRRIQAAIQEHRANLVAVMEATEDGIWSLDREYRATIVNTAFQTAFAKSFGRPIEIGENLLACAEPVLAAIWKERYDRVLAGERFTVQDHDPSTGEEGRDLEFRFSPIDVDGQTVGASVTMHDISAQKQYERQLQVSRDLAEEANRTKSLFLANMSHEIRTPMNGIIGLAHLLTETQLSEGQQRYVRQLQSCADSLLGLIDDILDLSKIEAGKVECENLPFDLHQLLHDTVDMVDQAQQHQQVAVTLHLAADVPVDVSGDPVRLRQCLTNLLSNALKFTPQGRVDVSVAVADDGNLSFTVQDTGIGIPADRLKAIFEAFVQADISTTRTFGGTGLGLAITHQLVQLMGGMLTVDSVVDEGSTFSFTLPLPALVGASTGGVSPAPEPDSLAERHWDAARVLVVDDNDVNIMVAEGLLKNCGVTTAAARSGQEALQHLASENFDLVLMDCHMPLMDGLEVTRRVRSGEGGIHNPKVPVIAVTADAMDGAAAECRAAGMNDYLSKPIKRERLLEVLDKFLAGV